MSELGLRVVRGPDWSWRNEDGGEGCTGTLYHKNDNDKTAIIQWDNGNQTLCKIGQMNKYELRIIDNAQIGIVHENFYCNECLPTNIKGTRYKCNVCINYNLCNLCNLTKEHDLRHSFNKIKSPTSSGSAWNGREDPIHMGVQCDECLFIDIRGARYKCFNCPDYDLCNSCYHTGKHDLPHIFIRFDSPYSLGIKLPLRAISRLGQAQESRHWGVQCDGCNVCDICGIRYKCNVCHNYDLCGRCYNTNKHDLTHSFKAITFPNSEGTDLPPRVSPNMTSETAFVSEPIHWGVSCDECSYTNLQGKRYKCTICYNFDLCARCYNSNKHNLSHSFEQIDMPHAAGKNLVPRLISKKNNRRSAIHEGVFCDACSCTNIYGIKYTCNDCINYDLCYLCYHGDKHNLSHCFKRIDKPQSMGIVLPPRETSRKCQLRGIFKGTKVVPGIDWDWGNKDKPGVVLGITKWKDEKSWRSAAYVKWKEGGKQLCRLGYNGHCDIQCVGVPQVHTHYYPEHLPILGQSEEQMCLNPVLQETDVPLQENVCGADFLLRALSLNETRETVQLVTNTMENNTASSLNAAAGSDERVRQLESKIAEMEQSQTCVICLEAKRNMVFLCGHGTCSSCAAPLQFCPMCRKKIEKKIRIY